MPVKLPGEDPSSPQAWGRSSTFEDSPEKGEITGGKAGIRFAEKPPTAVQLVTQCLKTAKLVPLQAWFSFFDKNHNGTIDFEEFSSAMKTLQFHGNMQALWDELDADGSGEITLEELDADQAKLWSCFKSWCGRKFKSPKDMILQIKQAGTPQDMASVAKSESLVAKSESFADKKHADKPDVVLLEQEFVAGVKALGWSQGFEIVLFAVLDNEGNGVLAQADVRWVEGQIRQHQLKESARAQASLKSSRRAFGKLFCKLQLKNFKVFLKKHFGSLYLGWRASIDLVGNMWVNQADLFKACRQMSWKGDMRCLWRALDRDNSGTASLEELAPRAAQTLARLKEWATKLWGSKPAAAMFQAIDAQGRRRLGYKEFAVECKAKGFEMAGEEIQCMLDWQSRRFIVQEDLSFLDSWRPPSWLTARPNMEAAREFKKLLMQRHGNYVRAWRATMDEDNSNNCDWHEFREAAKKLRFSGDLAGAWLIFDQELTGVITLEHISRSAHDALAAFKKWADNEFGSVKAVFKVLDADCSGDLSFREFRAAVRQFGFLGDVRTLFTSLDVGGEGSIDSKEVEFLDSWDIHEAGEMEALELQNQKPEQVATAHLMLEFSTPVPGPGAYNVPSSFAAKDIVPVARHSGAFSFAQRGPWLRLAKKTEHPVGPANYDPSLKTTSSRKPAWSFGHAGRKAELVGKYASPGPGAYELRPPSHGPKFSIRPRRGLHLHPNQPALVTSRPCSPRF